MLQRPLSAVIPVSEMEAILETFPQLYTQYYHQQMLHKLGFKHLSFLKTEELIDLTLQLLFLTKVGYDQFFRELKQRFSLQWREDADYILHDLEFLVSGEEVVILKRWCWLYHQLLLERSLRELEHIAQRLQQANPTLVLLKPQIESVWKSIAEADNWQPFVKLLEQLRFNNSG